MTLVSVIMPALNEAPVIADAIADIPLDRFWALGFQTEVLVVDNGSLDSTAELAQRAGARVVQEPRRGYGNAYRRGFMAARGSILCTLDADRTYPAQILPDLVSRLLAEDLAFISTNRFAFLTDGAMTRTNRWGNAILSHASRVLFDLPFHDSQSGMWVFRAELLERMRLRAGGMALSEEIKLEAACRLQVPCAEVPIHYAHRQGVSKLRVWRDGAGNLLYLLRKRLS